MIDFLFLFGLIFHDPLTVMSHGKYPKQFYVTQSAPVKLPKQELQEVTPGIETDQPSQWNKIKKRIM